MLISLIFLQCKKSVNQPTATIPSTNTSSKVGKFKDLAKELLSLAKRKDFVQLVYNECKSQKFGDYYVRVEDLLNLPNANQYFPAEKEKTIKKLLSDLQAFNARTPIIFYPSVETKEENKNSSRNLREATDFEFLTVIAVVDDGSSSSSSIGGGGSSYGSSYYTNETYPGYQFNTDGQLEYYQQITEDFAWENDVWVIGEEENLDEGNMVAAPEDFILNSDPPLISIARFQGQPEYGGIIQVTDFRFVEPWISGKLEFKYTVMNSYGTIILGPLSLGKVKRKYFKDLKWYDYNLFIGNWNTSTFGYWMYEDWIEEDGGESNPVTITTAPPAGTTGPTVTVSIPAKNRDNDLGVATIQFTDAITQVYNISYANLKRKH